jgi:hypothetical protein
MVMSARKFPPTKCPVLGAADWATFKGEHYDDVVAAVGSLDAADAAMAADGFALGPVHVFFNRRESAE